MLSSAPLRTPGLAAFLVACCVVSLAFAEVTKEQRSEISEIAKSVTPVATHVRKKEFDEADKLIKEAEEKLKSIATAAAVKEDDKAFGPARIAIQKAKNTLSLGKDKS